MLSDADRARAIFVDAIASGDAASRAEFVARSCGRDEQLRRWVDELLAVFDRAAAAPGQPSINANATTDFVTDAPGPAEPSSTEPTLTRSAVAGPAGGGSVPTETTDFGSGGPGDRSEALPTVTFTPDAEHERQRKPKVDAALGTVVGGKYTLESVIGEGGMGSVYLARQSEPVRREVAVKLIKAGFDSRGVLARFEAERQALALMEHPNIARVYDGGTTPGGAPFFAMELVRGVPITDYCDAKRLPPAARLDLFVQVCRAVQHAHQKGIIHRDLKPGNILVTEVDGKPTPKVIDFGVAKAIEQRLTDSSYSDVGAIVGTPSYMSPEQADPTSMDIDTRTDVYALGVVLYELLTGTPPIRAKEFRRGAVLEMLRMVREVEPPHPSTRASSDAALPSIAANRALEPRQLLAMLRGDIDWVIMKAIEKDRDRRYDSANGFATDILRYLSNEPVVARSPTRPYRLRKFVRRNRTGVTLAASFALLALAGALGVVYQWREAVFQRSEAVAARSEAERNFAVAMEQRMVALKALGQVLDIARKELPNLPAMQDVQRKVLGVARESLENIAENPLVRVSLKDTTLAAAHASAARLHVQTGDVALGVAEFRRAEAIYERILEAAPEGAERDTVKQNLALIKMALAQTSLRIETPAQARLHLESARELLGQLGPDAPADFRRNLATLFRMVGAVTSDTDPREGRRVYGDSLRVSEELAADRGTAENLLPLADSYLLVGGADFRLRDPASCEKLYRQALSLAEGEAGKTDSLAWKGRLAQAHERLADLFIRTGRTTDARDHYRVALRMVRAASLADPKNVEAAADHSRVLYSLALAEARAGDNLPAAEHFKTSLEIREARVRAKPEGVALKDLMVSLAQAQKPDEAARVAETVTQKFGTDPMSLVDVACCYAICSGTTPPGAAGREAAERYAVRAVEALKKAVELGYRNVVNLETEPDLDRLRARTDFARLLADLTAKSR